MSQRGLAGSTKRSAPKTTCRRRSSVLTTAPSSSAIPQGEALHVPRLPFRAPAVLWVPCLPSGNDRTGWMQESSWERRSSRGASYWISRVVELRVPHRAHEGFTSQLHRTRLLRWTWEGDREFSISEVMFLRAHTFPFDSSLKKVLKAQVFLTACRKPTGSAQARMDPFTSCQQT